ncbi:MAG: cytochrome C [Gemmatimonadetes bacterium]|nr:cytochrome C [Gemmatimonadota bacterium]
MWNRVVGPRIPSGAPRGELVRYALPTALFAAAAVLLIVSVFVPYWRMTLHAPQYPRGLHLQAYLTHLTGDVHEIDGLNHYIGMRPLGEAATFERSVAVLAVASLAALIGAAIFVHSRFAAALALPALLFPAGFLIDLYLWMRHFGLNLDERAPLSAAVKPFVPPVLGEGFVGQFRTVAVPDAGLIMAAVASLLVLAGLWAHRRAYKPLFDAMGGEEGTP